MTTDHIGPSSAHVRLSRRVLHHGIGHGVLRPRDLCRLGDPGGERGPGRPGTPRRRIGVSAVTLVVPRCRHGKTGRGTMVRTLMAKIVLQEENQ